MFARTLALADDCGLTHLHVFPFSPRAGTPAARMPQLARDVIKARAATLRERGGQRLRQHLDAQFGRTLTLLAERGDIGRAEDFTPVKIVGVKPGRMIRVTISGHDGERLF
jgi:threonylcarbamoyladenosine tRNA methylthiotransferase MtaB